MKRVLPLIAGITATLTACTPPESTVAQPPQAGGMSGLYQIDFTVDGDSVRATMHPVFPSGRVAGQQLTDAPELLFDPRPIVVRTQTFNRNGAPVRHISSTFGIMNNTTDTLGNFMMLPVVRGDADADASNNPVAPTIAGTPFLNIRLFDGSDGSFNAPKMHTGAAQVVNARTGEILNDPDASPYFTGLDVSQVSVPAPAGMTTKVMNEGWQVASSFSPGVTRNVTFAVEVPVDPASMRQQPYSFSLLVTGAHEIGAVANPQPGTIQNVVTPWSYGSRYGLYAEYSKKPLGQGVINPIFVKVADIATGGQVSAALPAPTTLSGFLANHYAYSGCTMNGSMSVTDFAHAIIWDYHAMTADQDKLGIIQEQTLNGQRVIRMFSETNVQAKFTSACGGWPKNMDVDFTLKQGWNTLLYSETSSVATYRNLPAGTPTQLTLTPAAPGVTMLFPESPLFTLPIGGPAVQRTLLIRQMGDLSGPVTLETSDPSIQISPSTLTLPLPGSAVSGASVRAQALQLNAQLSAAAGAKPGRREVQVIARQGGVEVGRLAINADVGYPGADFGAGVSGVLRYGERTVTLSPTLNSVYGYSGPVTVTVSGLPAEFETSTPVVTVNVVNGVPQTVPITLSLKPDVPTPPQHTYWSFTLTTAAGSNPVRSTRVQLTTY